MEKTDEVEEANACSYQNYDPDIALSYIDKKIQDVLGHFQKDFERGVSAENLGAKFGQYGSFLPAYLHLPLRQHPQMPQVSAAKHNDKVKVGKHEDSKNGASTAARSDVCYVKNARSTDLVEKSVSKITSKENSYGKKRDKPSIPDENPKEALTEASTIESEPLIKEDWVRCDKCQKWRLLPFDKNPDDLPEKWVCSMLNWLPGMNRCIFSEEETTKALVARQQLPDDGGSTRGSSLVGGSMLDRKKRNGVKGVSASTNPSAKNKFQASVKCNSLNGEIRGKRDAEPDRASISKKAKVGDHWMQDHNRSMGKVGLTPTAISGIASGKNLRENDNHLTRDRKKDANTKSKNPCNSSNIPSTSVRKRKMCDSDNDDRKEKKGRISKSLAGEEISSRKGSLKGDFGSAQPCQGSSKVSGFHKNRTISNIVKGSPVESVSSYPLRFVNQDESKSTWMCLYEKDDFGAQNGKRDGQKQYLHSVTEAQKENEAKNTITGATVGDDTSKPPKPEKQCGNQPRRDSSCESANSVIKEATDLEHLADRLKNNGSHAESTSLYFHAATKFLHGASLLESLNRESAEKDGMIKAMEVYSSAAKLCEFCANEYEKSKDFAAAALAYKLMEVAYMRVIYSSNTNARDDRHELQTALQTVPLGESPCSSASDIDNLNNVVVSTDKAPLVKGVASPRVGGKNVTAARNLPNLARMLNFAQDVNNAMDASTKSRNAFAAATTRSKASLGGEGISSVKKALDFSFHDVERLVRLVRVAMDAISP